jgi:hypothetical protein
VLIVAMWMRFVVHGELVVAAGDWLGAVELLMPRSTAWGCL